MFQATTLIAVAIVTAHAFDMKRNQLPTNSLVNLGKIDVAVYYNPPNGKPAENDILMNNELFQASLPFGQAPQHSCPCSHMKSFGKDPSLSVLSKLFGGVQMANDVPNSPNCCDVFEIVEEDHPLDLLQLQDNLEPFQLNNYPFNLPLTPPKSNSPFRPKAVEIVILPNKKNKRQYHAGRDDIKVVGEKKVPKFKKMNKSQGQKGKPNDKTVGPLAQPNFGYGISNVEILVETKPVKTPDAPSSTVQPDSGKSPSVKKDLNALTTPTGPMDVTTTKTSASPADVDVFPEN